MLRGTGGRPISEVAASRSFNPDEPATLNGRAFQLSPLSDSSAHQTTGSVDGSDCLRFQATRSAARLTDVGATRIPETSDRDALAALGAAPAQYLATAERAHAGPKSVHLLAAPVMGLESPLHRSTLSKGAPPEGAERGTVKYVFASKPDCFLGSAENRFGSRPCQGDRGQEMSVRPRRADSVQISGIHASGDAVNNSNTNVLRVLSHKLSTKGGQTCLKETVSGKRIQVVVSKPVRKSVFWLQNLLPPRNGRE